MVRVASAKSYGMTQNTTSHLSVKRYIEMLWQSMTWHSCAIYKLLYCLNIAIVTHNTCVLSFSVIALYT